MLANGSQCRSQAENGEFARKATRIGAVKRSSSIQEAEITLLIHFVATFSAMAFSTSGRRRAIEMPIARIARRSAGRLSVQMSLKKRSRKLDQERIRDYHYQLFRERKSLQL